MLGYVYESFITWGSSSCFLKPPHPIKKPWQKKVNYKIPLWLQLQILKITPFFYAGDLVVGEGVILNGTLEVPNKAMVSGAINGDLKVHSLAVGIIGKHEGKVACTARLATPILRVRTCDLRFIRIRGCWNIYISQ